MPSASSTRAWAGDFCLPVSCPSVSGRRIMLASLPRMDRGSRSGCPCQLVARSVNVCSVETPEILRHFSAEGSRKKHGFLLLFAASPAVQRAGLKLGTPRTSPVRAERYRDSPRNSHQNTRRGAKYPSGPSQIAATKVCVMVTSVRAERRFSLRDSTFSLSMDVAISQRAASTGASARKTWTGHAHAPAGDDSPGAVLGPSVPPMRARAKPV